MFKNWENPGLAVAVFVVIAFFAGHMSGYSAGRADIYEKIMYNQVWKKPETIQEDTCSPEKP